MLARVLGPVKGEEQLRIQQSMLRRKDSWNVFVTCCVGRCGGSLALELTGSAYGSGFALCGEEDYQNVSHAR